ncbi:laccase-11-like [Gossypium australe]|uniref:Laccase-11-like n=1 Tax=Gossypium australe TaxID=47621 RepID=A0A5B6VZF7_9ROSI|nr:laccase-11-like [Gossypium australe]
MVSFFLVVFLAFISFPIEAAVKKYQFNILVKNISRLCHAKPTVVNGRFPGPTIYAREGDRVIVNVTNHAKNITCPFIAILIAPGQTTNVLVRANWLASRYFMAARPFMDAPLPVDNKTATAILQYKGIPNIVLPTRPQLPASNDTDFALSYNKKLRSLNSAKFPAIVPLKVDRKLFYTVGFGKDLCTTCVKGTRLLASLNIISFVMPKIGLLQAHYFNTKRVFRIDFPDKPPKPFNYTGAPLTADLGTAHGTRLSKFAFNSTVELALQDTNILKV